MPRDFFDLTPEEQQVVLIDAETLHKAEQLIESCEHCNEEGPKSLSITSSIALPAPILASRIKNQSCTINVSTEGLDNSKQLLIFFLDHQSEFSGTLLRSNQILS
jgi:hypothetical protein